MFFSKCIYGSFIIKVLHCLLGLSTLSFISCQKKSTNDNNVQSAMPVSTGGGELVKEAESYIGVNYNEGLHEVKMGELSRSKTKWVRGFLDVFHHYYNQNLNTSPRIIEYLKLKDAGYKTMISLKFNFKTRLYPVINSSEWNNYITFIDKILDKIIAKTDVIVVGNEPFIESDAGDQNEPLNSFYKAAANRVNQYLVTFKIKRPIFIGFFDNMFQSSKQNNTGINNLLAFCKSTPWIAGIDAHIHHTEYAEVTTALNFLNIKIRDDQKIIITEYSLMKWWRNHSADNLSADFLAAANSDPADRIFPPPADVTKVWQFVDYALKNLRPVEEWNAFNQHTSWLQSRKDYLCRSYKLFKGYPKFWVAAYAMRQSYPLGSDFTATIDPWVLNSLFTGRSVEALPNGEAQGRYGFFDEFSGINTMQNFCN